MITIRPQRPEDKRDIAEVEASATATLRKTYRPNQKALMHKRNITPEIQQLVAERDGHVIGVIGYYVSHDVMHILGLGVHHTYRGCGIGSSLVKSVIVTAQDQNIPALVVQTVEETGNVPFFEALGFQVASRCADEYAESTDGRKLTDVCLMMEFRKDRI